jgi:putative transcriptional regulator
MSERHTTKADDDDAAIEAAALSDLDCPPSTPEQLAKAVRMPNLRALRHRLGLTQEGFAERYDVPVASVRDWEQRRTVPDKAVRTYLRAIALEPEVVAEIVGRGTRTLKLESAS